jgi:hypothetical protein
MARTRLLLLLALVVLAVPATAVGAGVDGAQVDRGLEKPPAKLSSSHKAIWMSEWVACWRVKTLQQFARELKMKNPNFITPQQSARLLSVRAMRFLYEDPAELVTARDGCRNGILWRFYHD